ncbi:MAG: helix-turn-helix transcriptional regulator [Verrucomicrobiota bacterium]
MSKSIYGPEQESLQFILHEARNEAKLTQAQLADKMGVPQSFVSKYESGERRLDLVELRTVCLAIDLPLIALIRRWEKALK